MIVIAGPTASGKTALAVALARRLGGEIVSADSRQVYRRLDAGTAKPSASERAAARHWLLDVADPAERFDAGRWAREAAAAVADIRARGRLPIVCGGTGLYLRALLEGLAPLPPADPALRARLAAEAEKGGREALHRRLAAADPEAAAGIPPRNLQRVIRALEVLELTGRPLSEHWRAGRAGATPAALTLSLELPAAASRERVELRARGFWGALVAEVRALVPASYRGDEPGFESLGYREALAVARGETADADGLAALVAATAAYAKRQRTWFRGQLAGAVRLDASDQAALERAALRAWEGAREKAAV